MKKDVIIYFKDGEKLVVVGVDENMVVDAGGDKFLGLVDMHGNAYAIDGESIKYIKIEPHEEAVEHAEKHD